MSRKLGINILILCFSVSNINFARATETMPVAPIIVQPYEIQQLTQQMIDRDEQNRNEEAAIQALIEQNNKLTQNTLASQEDEGLRKINQTMLQYRQAIYSRNQAHMADNGGTWPSRYGDLVLLTEDADSMTVHRDLVDRRDLVEQKYQLLEDLKDEMTALNEKLAGRDTADQKESIITGFKNIAQEQEDKIQTLTQKLEDTDQKIAQFDAIIAQKDQQIFQLKNSIADLQSEAASQDDIIKQQKTQLELLQKNPRTSVAFSSNGMELPPIIVDGQGNEPTQPPVFNGPLSDLQRELSFQSQIIKQQQNQIAALQAQSKFSPSSSSALAQLQREVSYKNEVIKQQQDQLNLLQTEPRSISYAKGNMALPPIIVNGASGNSSVEANQLADLQSQVSSQNEIIKQQQNQIDILRTQPNAAASAREEKLLNSIHWLNQVLAATRNKAEYYKLTSQRDQLAVQEVQGEVQNMKEDLAHHLNDYNQVETSMVSLKDQVSQLAGQLSQKQAQVDQLKSQLESQSSQENNQSQLDIQTQQELKDQIQDKENQIIKMRSDLKDILEAQAKKAIYNRKTFRPDDRIPLAKQLIGLQEQEASLLNQKSDLEASYNVIFDQHVVTLENKIEALFVNRQIQMAQLKNQMEELDNKLDQNEEQVGELKTELENKLANEKNQSVLAGQIQDLDAQIQDKDNQIASLKAEVQSGQDSETQANALRQQVMAKQGELKQMTVMLQDYQQKLESKNSAFNDQYGQILNFKNYQAQMEKQVANLNARLRRKENEVIKIKKDLYDLQEQGAAIDKDTQAKDLSLSIEQQKAMDEKINEYQAKVDGLQATNASQAEEVKQLKTELALAREQLGGMPSSDEIEFLRAGLKKTTLQLKQRDAALAEIKANADEYNKAFKDQTKDFESLKDQLLNAQQDIARKDEDLKYKDLAIKRLKYISQSREKFFQESIAVLKHDLAIEKKQLEQLKARLGNKAPVEAPVVAPVEAPVEVIAQSETGLEPQVQALKDQNSDLQAQVAALTQKIAADEKKLQARVHASKSGELQAQLDNANETIKGLRKQLDQFESFYRKDPSGEKLRQALNKIDQQGRVINALVQKLQDAGQSVDLSKIADK